MALASIPVASPRGAPASLRHAIVAAVVRSCLLTAGPGLRAIVLAGSLARDEVTVAPTACGSGVIGDAEFLLVYAARTPLPSAGRLEWIAAAAANALLRRGLRCKIGLDAVGARYLRRMGPHIFGFELRQTGRVVWGDPNLLRALRTFPASSIGRHDAWYLLSNRLIEQLEAAAVVTASAALPPPLAYASLKLWLDMASSYLVFRGRFVAGYRARQLVLSRLACRPQPAGTPLPFSLPEFARVIERCTDWKLDPKGPPADLGWPFWRTAVQGALALWDWELETMAGETGAGRAAVWARAAAGLSWRARARGWLSLLRRQGWLRSWRNWPRWCRLARRAAPRWCVYHAAAALCRRLPALLGADAAGCAEFPGQEVLAWLPVPAAVAAPGGWRAVAAAIAWNFHRFVEKTRA